MRPSPRVICGECHFAWYSPSAAHGLRLLGSCPRCCGELEFLTEEEPTAVPAASDDLSQLAPAAVLGMPTSWADR